MPTSAAAKVFDIAELVEHVFSFCSLDDILMLDNINHYMRNLIATSPKLQRIMTMEPGILNTTTHGQAIRALQDRLGTTHSPYLNFPPFQRQAFRITDISAPKDEWTLDLHYTLYLPCMQAPSSEHPRSLRWTSPSPASKHAGASWRTIKFPPAPVRLSITVVAGRHGPACRCAYGSYRIEDPERESLALGDVADRLEEVLAVPVGVHRRRARRARRASWV